MIEEFVKGKKVALTKNFNSKEFDCKCKQSHCQKTLIDLDGVLCLQKARDLLGKAIKLTSGFRCETHNKSVGGVSSSLHLKGTAFDLACPKDIDLNTFAFICEQAGFNGVLRYDGDGFVHCDMRSSKYFGVTNDGGKSFKQVDTFNPEPTEKSQAVNMPILKKGCEGECVKMLQILLNSKGFKGKNKKVLTVDGSYGTNTEFAVLSFRKSCNLKDDPTVDSEAWQRLLGVEQWN